MIIYRITLDITGDNLSPDVLISELSKELEVVNSFKSTDLKRGLTEEYGFGGIFYGHPQIYCMSGSNVEQYENHIIQYLKKNYQKIIENGGTDISVSYDIYFTGDNFMTGILDKEMLKTIGDCNTSLSLSVYQMTEEELQELFKEELEEISNPKII